MKRVAAARSGVTTIAGGTPGFAGEGGLVINAQRNAPRGIAVAPCR